MGVLGVRVRVASAEHDVLVILTEDEGVRSLPIVIGPHEGVAIATAQAGVASPRPGPHDLVLSSLSAAGVALASVSICELRSGTFIAELVLDNGRRVDSRASDAIVIALRAGVDVWCADDVLDEASVILESYDGDDASHIELANEAGEDDAVAQFREFLDGVTPSDFDETGGVEDR